MPITFRRCSALLVALVLGLGAVHLNAQARKPYTKEQILGMLKGEVAPQRVAVLARQRGIDFEITPQVESEVRQAGATDALLATLRSLAPKPAQIIVQTSPGAEVFLDDQYSGRASTEGRLVIANPRTGPHKLRVSLAGKKDYMQDVIPTAGETVTVDAKLADLAAGATEINPKDGLKYVWIPPGTFMMGCSPGDSECDDEEKPSHRVTFSKGFWIGQTPVTVGAYKRFAASAGRPMPDEPSFNSGWSNENMPIVDVTWDDATAYCGWSGGRLPTEAEWEYAARAGSTEARYGDLDAIAWDRNNSGLRTHNVGEKQANAFGLYDMLGNVRQWVDDWYDANYYQSSPSQDPPGPSSGQDRVLRGGSWDSDSKDVRVSYRVWFSPGDRDVGSGFRCVREVGIP
ncbi:MAG TPA: SUMF1/EgtB/PvdO family nonheme iron enzyme [Terriglobia bacterium]|nr:SUMF1/EgtB/PvdO family nonheme iron enzyme [Terriglobia bacterium]